MLRQPDIALRPVLLVLLVALVDDEVEVEDGPGEEQHREDDLSHLGGITGGSRLISRKKKSPAPVSLPRRGVLSFSGTGNIGVIIVCVKKLKVKVTANTDCRGCNKEEAEGD